MKDGIGEGFVFGVIVALVLTLMHFLGGMSERESISRYGGFTHYETYKCEVVKK